MVLGIGFRVQGLRVWAGFGLSDAATRMLVFFSGVACCKSSSLCCQIEPQPLKPSTLNPKP